MPGPFSSTRLSLVECLAQPADYSHIAHIIAEARRRLATTNNRLPTDPASATVAVGNTYFEAAVQTLAFYDGANAHDKAIFDKRHQVVLCARYFIFVARTDGVKVAKRKICEFFTIKNHRYLWRFIARELGPVHGENIANDLEHAFLTEDWAKIAKHLASMAAYSSLEADEQGRRSIQGQWSSIVKQPSERAQRADARVAEPGTVPDSDDSPQGDFVDEDEDDSDDEADDLAREAEAAEEYDSIRTHVFHSDLRDRADECRRGPMSASLAACNAAFKKTLEPAEKDLERTLATFCAKLNKLAEQFRGHGIKIAAQKDIPIPPLATWPYSYEALEAALDLQRCATAPRTTAATASSAPQYRTSTYPDAPSVGGSRASGQPSVTVSTLTRTTTVSDQSNFNSLSSRARHPSLPLSYASAAAQSVPIGTRSASGSTTGAPSSGTFCDSGISRSLTRTSSDAGRFSAAPGGSATTRVSGNMASDQAAEASTRNDSQASVPSSSHAPLGRSSHKRAQREDDLEDERVSKLRRYFPRAI
ncbi:uncharacterized protein SCHCODRAFT_02742573 [Schizophyllum commune H4-8]|uniref:Expressed protein n=1 Tax=Schizophyllum commune (strain H4-8 / FGSC 9210) TaxID=578458 RepID=D8PSZ6_SCHCM|nr:uncharacterized protein SCHCODRAFT_02742573 [Schizophyllum commune H4-8]KAI5899490.1 hypothetical protein SCHCODRAFT_02742573 [Schizophyllum commune H4-8]